MSIKSEQTDTHTDRQTN